MSQINAKRKKRLFVNTKLINDLAKCVTSERNFPQRNFVFPTQNLSDQRGKPCHKITHILHFQSLHVSIM